METNNHRTPFMAIHPVETIKDEIKARGMSKKELAQRMDMQQSNLSRMLSNKSDITLDMAERLEKALGISADFWIRMQTNYRQDVEAIAERDKEEEEAIKTETMLNALLNIHLLFQALGFKATLFVQEKMKMLEELLGFKPNLIPQLSQCFAGNYKKSDKCSEDEKAETTWRLLAYIKGKSCNVNNKFQSGNARKSAQKIADTLHKGKLTEKLIQEILSEHGIAYSKQENLQHTHIDAFSTWTDEHPTVIVTHRYKDMTRLVFNVLHELGHIELHLEKDKDMGFVATDKTYSSDDPKELEANKFAEDMLIAPNIWRKINSQMWSFNTIVPTLQSFASDNNLDFHTVAWRFKYETGKYNLKGVKAVPIQ